VVGGNMVFSIIITGLRRPRALIFTFQRELTK
jgi:hypothetical protein